MRLQLGEHRRGPPVSLIYKGFPRCQAKLDLDRIVQRSIKGYRTRNHDPGFDHVEQRARCGLEKLQPVIVQQSLLRTLMKDARGGPIR